MWFLWEVFYNGTELPTTPNSGNCVTSMTGDLVMAVAEAGAAINHLREFDREVTRVVISGIDNDTNLRRAILDTNNRNNYALIGRLLTE